MKAPSSSFSGGGATSFKKIERIPVLITDFDVKNLQKPIATDPEPRKSNDGGGGGGAEFSAYKEIIPMYRHPISDKVTHVFVKFPEPILFPHGLTQWSGGAGGGGGASGGDDSKKYSACMRLRTAPGRTPEVNPEYSAKLIAFFDSIFDWSASAVEQTANAKQLGSFSSKFQGMPAEFIKRMFFKNYNIHVDQETQLETGTVDKYVYLNEYKGDIRTKFTVPSLPGSDLPETSVSADDVKKFAAFWAFPVLRLQKIFIGGTNSVKFIFDSMLISEILTTGSGTGSGAGGGVLSCQADIAREWAQRNADSVSSLHEKIAAAKAAALVEEEEAKSGAAADIFTYAEDDITCAQTSGILSTTGTLPSEEEKLRRNSSTSPAAAACGTKRPRSPSLQGEEGAVAPVSGGGGGELSDAPKTKISRRAVN